MKAFDVGLVCLCLSALPMTVVGRATGPELDSQPAAAEQPPCSTAEYRQFDFWIGEWDVKNPAGDIVGSNRIERVLGGCALQENWNGTGGSQGHSYNIYDRATRRWHQTWVDNSGLLLQLDGQIEGDTMTLSGETTDADGRTVTQQISWQVRLDGSVRQHWQSSTDGGRTWSTVFDGLYVKKRR